MDWPKAYYSSSSSSSSSANGDMINAGNIKRQVERLMGPTKVMTDDQVEELRHQISVYTVITEQLVAMYRSMTARQDPVAGGMNLGSQHGDPTMLQRIAPRKHTKYRQRWCPMPEQREILERMYELSGTPPKKRQIQEIANELSKYGQVSESSVYVWFQNKRARMKREEAKGNARMISEYASKFDGGYSNVKPELMLAGGNQPTEEIDAPRGFVLESS